MPRFCSVLSCLLCWGVWGFSNKQVPVSQWPGGCYHWWARHAQCVDVFASLGSVGFFICSKQKDPSGQAAVVTGGQFRLRVCSVLMCLLLWGVWGFSLVANTQVPVSH